MRPSQIVHQYVESLLMCSKGTRETFPFGIPMIRREPRDHSNDCYFSVLKASAYKKDGGIYYIGSTYLK